MTCAPAYNAGMVIARPALQVRINYNEAGESDAMFMKYVKSLSMQECPVILSVTETKQTVETTTVIQRNADRVPGESSTSDIYLRAREIYFRARRQRPVRAASIF